MTEKRKALGRGLESLLPPRPFSSVPPTLSPTTGEKGGASDIVPSAAPGTISAPGDGGAAFPGTLPSSPDAVAGATATTVLLPGERVQELALDHLDPNPYQTRATMNDDAMEELRASIAAMGVIEP